MRQIKRFLKRFALTHIILEKRNYYKKKHIVKALKEGSLIDKLGASQKDHWIPRIKLVIDSPDNSNINHVGSAATFNKDYNLVMHNGLVIDPLSYYGLPMLEILYRNKAVHEPQEEYAFQEILKEIPDSAVMIELGSYWSFYSMWFNSEVKGARNYMIEPVHINSGRKNFKLNSMTGDFTNAYISDCEVVTSAESEAPTICIDNYIKEKKIEFVDILHADIQGYEYKMFLGAENLLNLKNVGYIFVSTHSQELHTLCLEHLNAKGYNLVCSADLEESYSWDGLLVFKNPSYNGVDKLNISKRKK